MRPGTDVYGGASELPMAAADMIRRVRGVEAASATRNVDGVGVRRTDHIPELQTNGITVIATESTLLDTLGVVAASGSSAPRSR